MKRRTVSLFLLLVLLLTACGGQRAEIPSNIGAERTWQEQYDLGIRYLSDGNYAEAIIAFTAAIQIDPKQVDAYIGRGDAYVGNALSTGEGYENAEADYLAAVELDGSIASLYGKLADIYIALGDIEAARDILERGYAATADAELGSRLEEWNRKPVGTLSPGQALFAWSKETIYSVDGEVHAYCSIVHDENGRPVSGEMHNLFSDDESPSGEVSTMEFVVNDAGYVVKIIQHFEKRAFEYIVEYQWDDAGRLVGIVDPSMEEKQSIINNADGYPEKIIIEDDYGVQEDVYEWGADGRLMGGKTYIDGVLSFYAVHEYDE